MRWIALLLVAVVMFAGCTDDGAGSGTSDADDDPPATGQPAENETVEQRDPSTQASTADCTFAYAGSRTGTGSDVQLGPAQETCEALLEPVDAEPLPFQVAYIEMEWDEADPTIDEVGFDFTFTYNGTDIGSGSASVAPGGAGGSLTLEVSLQGAGAGSIDATGELDFTGSTSSWEAAVAVSAFETSTVPGGYTAL